MKSPTEHKIWSFKISIISLKYKIFTVVTNVIKSINLPAAFISTSADIMKQQCRGTTSTFHPEDGNLWSLRVKIMGASSEACLGLACANNTSG